MTNEIPKEAGERICNMCGKEMGHDFSMDGVCSWCIRKSLEPSELTQLRARVKELELENQKLRDRRDKYIERNKELENAMIRPIVIRKYAQEAANLAGYLRSQADLIEKAMRKEGNE